MKTRRNVKLYKLTLPAFMLVIILAAVFFFPVLAPGQERNEEVTIIAPYEPSITDPVKINFSIPPDDMPKESVDPQFTIIDTALTTQLTLNTLQPKQPARDPAPEFTRNYIKAGFGSNLMPWLLFTANSLPDKKFQTGLKISHLSTLSSVRDYAPGSSSHSQIGLNGSKTGKKSRLQGNLEYDRFMVHHYGFKPDDYPETEVEADSIRQRYQTIDAGLRFANNYSSNQDLNYNVSLGFYHLDNITGTSENSFNLHSTVSKGAGFEVLSGSGIFKLDAGLDYFGYHDSLASSNRLIIDVTPSFQLDSGPYRLILGAAMYFAEDANFVFNFFPVLRGEIVIIENQLRAYAEINGGRRVNSYRSLVSGNPHLISTPVMRDQIDKFELSGGIRGSVSSVDYYAEISSVWAENIHLFITDSTTLFGNEFEVIYGDSQILKMGGGITFRKVNKAEFTFKGNYYIYSMGREAQPWHRRNSDLTLSARYIYNDKLRFTGSIYYLGGFYAAGFQGSADSEIKIKGGFDLNLGAEYYLTPSFTIFAALNNIINDKYQRWYNYPVQGFQVMAGVTYSF